MTDVKRLSKRTERARQTRQRIVEAARDLFVEQGYGATTLQEVATKAGVAVQTVYFVFGNKRMLLKELADVTIAGDDAPVTTMERDWFRDALAAETAGAQLRAYIAGTRHILERVAPIMQVLAAATASDPEVAALWPHGDDPRYQVHATAAKSLTGKAGARDGVSAEHAADVLFAVLSPELYRLLVRDRGWSPEQWERWAHETLRPQLCAD